MDDSTINLNLFVMNSADPVATVIMSTSHIGYSGTIWLGVMFVPVFQFFYHFLYSFHSVN
jgi:hypothetical protein